MLVLGLHSLEDAAAPGRGGARCPRGGGNRRSRRQAALAWRDFMVSNYSDIGQERWLADRGSTSYAAAAGWPAPGVVEVDGVRHTAEHVVVATGADCVRASGPGTARARGRLGHP